MFKPKKLADMTRSEVLVHPAYIKRMDSCIDGAIRHVKHGEPSITRINCTTDENSDFIEVVEVYSNNKLFCTLESRLTDGKFVINFTAAKSIPSSSKINSN